MSPSGPLTSHQLLAGTGADRGGSRCGWAGTRALAHCWSSSSDTKEVACWLCPFQIRGRTYFAPEMANLCAPLPVTVPSTPAPSLLHAGPLPGGGASRPPSQWGVGKGRLGGEWGRRLGEGGTQWPSAEGRGAVPSESLLFSVQTRFPGTEATFLHLGQAETVASNWDSQQRHGPSGILSFSFSLSPFLRLSFAFSLSPSPFLPPYIGVYLQSLQWARVPRREDY